MHGCPTAVNGNQDSTFYIVWIASAAAGFTGTDSGGWRL